MLSSEPGMSTGGSKDCKGEKKKKEGFGGFWGVHGTTGAHQLFPLFDHCTSLEAGFRWFQLCQPILLTAGGLKPEARPRFLGIRPKAFDQLTAFADGQVIGNTRSQISFLITERVTFDGSFMDLEFEIWF